MKLEEEQEQWLWVTPTTDEQCKEAIEQLRIGVLNGEYSKEQIEHEIDYLKFVVKVKEMNVEEARILFERIDEATSGICGSNYSSYVIDEKLYKEYSINPKITLYSLKYIDNDIPKMHIKQHLAILKGTMGFLINKERMKKTTKMVKVTVKANYKPFYDKNGIAQICKACCENHLKELLKKHHVKRISSKNIPVLMQVVYDFIRTVEQVEPCKKE